MRLARPGFWNSDGLLKDAIFLLAPFIKLDRFGPSVCRRSLGEPFAKAYKEKSLQAKLMRKSHFKRKGVREIP